MLARARVGRTRADDIAFAFALLTTRGTLRRTALGGAGLVGSWSSERRRVVVTGLGMVSPIGNSVEESWRALLEGRSGAARISRFDAGDLATRFACEVKDLDLGEFVDHKAARRMAGAPPCVGGGASGRVDSGSRSRRARECRHRYRDGAWRRRVFREVRDPADSPRAGPRSPFYRSNASEPCRRVGLDRARHAGTAADGVDSLRSVEHGLGDGLDAIRLGRADVMFCGGKEVPVTGVVVASFGAMRALSPRNDDPTTASRPFDGARDGFVMAEEAAVLVLEELEQRVHAGHTSTPN